MGEVFTRRNNAISVLVITGIFYIKSCYRTLPPGDSSDLIISAHQLGIAHPPGYPLLTILGRIWLWFCPLRAAVSLNILNCIIAALSNFALYHFLSVGTKSEIPALIGTLWFAFSDNVWEYSILFENFALNNLLCISLLYTYFSYLENVKSDGLTVYRTNRDLYYYGLVISGLAMANQHMSILIVAPIGIHVLFIESQTPRDMDLKKSAKYLGIPLALYLYLPFSAIIISTPWKWGHCQSIIGFLMHIMRMDYGSFILSHYGTAGARSSWEIMQHFFVLMKWEFKGYLGQILALAGAGYVLSDKKNHFGRMIFVVLLVSLLLFSFMIQSDPYIPLNTGIISRLWLQPTIFYVTFIAFGLKLIMDKTAEVLKRLDDLPPLAYDLFNAGFVEGIIWICSIMLCMRVYVYNDRSQLHIFERYTKMTMDLLPENALVISHGDSMASGLPYYQLVEKYRTDIDLIDGNMLTRHWWLDNHKAFHPTVKFPKHSYGDGFYKERNATVVLRDRLNFCRANIKRQIFICGTDNYLRYLEAQASQADAEFESIPWGHCDQIFIKSNHTFADKFLHLDGNYVKRQDELEKLTWWAIAPPHITKVPMHLWEFEINKEMWFQKIRLPRSAFDAAEEAIEKDDIELAMILYIQAAAMYRTEIDKVLMQTPKHVRQGFWVPPEWYKNYAMIHFRLANHGGKHNFQSFRIARQEMEKFVTFSKLMHKDIHWPREMKKIEVLDHVIRHNGTKTYHQAANDMRMNQGMSRTPGGADRHLPYLNDL